MTLQSLPDQVRTSNVQEERYWYSRHAKSVIFTIVVLVCIGTYLAFTIPLSVFPTTDFPRVVIAVDNGVMPIDQMMVTITRPIEETVNSVPGLESVRSITSRGSAEIDLFFDWHVDMMQTLQLVDAALSRVRTSLPPGVIVDTHRLTFASFPIIGYSLTSETMPQTQLWELATYELKPRLNRLNGVATVVVQGGQEPEFHIIPDPAKLLAASVTVTDILNAVKSTNLIDSPGLLEQNHQLYLGLINGQVRDPQQIAQIVIKNTQTGIPVRIGDVANVAPDVKPVYTIVTANGKPAVLLNISRQPDSNTVQVANEVHAEIASIQRSLPSGNRAATVLRPVRAGYRIDQERARCGSDRTDPRLHHHCRVPARLGCIHHRRAGDSGNGNHHVHRPQAPRPKFQPDDSRRTRRSCRTGD